MGLITLDFKKPDYTSVFEERTRRLAQIRENPILLDALRLHYKHNPIDFIVDWGVTFDPKNVEARLPALLPFVLFPKQREWVQWVVQHWRDREPGLTEKTRQMGFSWLSMAFSCTMCIFHDGMVVGVGSRKQEYVDILGDPKSLIEKGRIFMRHLPKEFRAGWTQKKHASHMRLTFPDTGAILAGEAGDNIGRGNTTSIYFVDEAAYLERPELVEASLSQTTNCRMDISTPRGLGNAFAQKRFGGKVDVFSFHWRDDPRKDDAWYAKQLATLDSIVVAQEIDIDYSASVEGVLIPSAWVQSAVDAHFKLKVAPSGLREASLDIADEGRDKNAWCGAHGILIEQLEEWSGKGSDILSTVSHAIHLCDLHGYTNLRYDADGVGAGAKGDARILNENRTGHKINVVAFRGSGRVFRPEHEDVRGRKNEDFFANAKAQAWWGLRTRFQKTHRWVTEGVVCDPDEIISISSAIPLYKQLVAELSQPTYKPNMVGKIVVDKTPDGVKSPNLADSVMMRFAEGLRPMEISPHVLNAAGARLVPAATGMKINTAALVR